MSNTESTEETDTNALANNSNDESSSNSATTKTTKDKDSLTAKVNDDEEESNKPSALNTSMNENEDDLIEEGEEEGEEEEEEEEEDEEVEIEEAFSNDKLESIEEIYDYWKSFDIQKIKVNFWASFFVKPVHFIWINFNALCFCFLEWFKWANRWNSSASNRTGQFNFEILTAEWRSWKPL